MSVANDELSDQEILEIYNKASYERKNGTDFHFSLKNKVGGLARALRVFQQNGLNVRHIESKQKRTDSEYDIFVNLQDASGGDVSLPELARSLKRQFSYIGIDETLCDTVAQQAATKKKLQKQKTLERSNSVMTNALGEPIRISKCWNDC